MPRGAHFIRVDPEGNIWTTDIKSHLVCKHSPEGKVLLTLGEAGRAGTDERHFDRPTDVVVLPTGDIFVSDGYGNRRVIHFDKTGKFVNQWGEAGTKPGQFALPHSIVADSRGASTSPTARTPVSRSSTRAASCSRSGRISSLPGASL